MRSPSTLDVRLVRAAASALSGRGSGAALLVLIYHRVLAAPDPLLPDEPDAARFAATLDLLGRAFRILPLAEALQRLRSRSLPSRAACITFDDGYANNCEVAMPLLLARGLPAAVFVAPGFVDGGCMFNDSIIEAVRRAPAVLDLSSDGLGCHTLSDAASRRHAIDELLGRLKYRDPIERLRLVARIAAAAGVELPQDLMLTSEQVRSMHRAGIEIGAHTVDHPILASIDEVTAREQIMASKIRLEAMIGAPVRAFAYPNGRPMRDYSRPHVEMVRQAGFDLALSTAWGAATRHSDEFQLPRVAAWDSTPLRSGLRLASVYRQRNYPQA